LAYNVYSCFKQFLQLASWVVSERRLPMSHRYELHSRQWQRIKHLFPDRYHHGEAGHPWKPHHQLLNGILWRLHSGAPWRDVPSRYGPWQTVYDRFRRWRLDGTWMRILTYLLDHLDKYGRLGRDLWCVDASIIRATRAAGGAEKKSRPRALVSRAKNKAIRGTA
jgi:transposase